MSNYIIKTIATMKDYNRDKWWVDEDIISEYFTSCPDIKTAINNYIDHVKNDCYIDISKNAIKNKSPMYRDTEDGTAIQTGFVITASMYFEDRENYKTSKQYIDLWVEVSELSNPFESEV